MKLIVARAGLLHALNHVSRVVERKSSTIPILSNARLAAANGRLAVEATDLQIAAIAGCAADVAQEGATTLPAATLHDIVRKLPEGADVAIEVSNGRAAIRAGRSRFALNALAVEDFPIFEEPSLPHGFEIGGKALAGILEQTAFAISTEETRYYLNGIYLHAIEGPLLRAVATDGHRLARVTAAVAGLEAGMPGVIVPRKTVAELARILKDHDDEKHGPVKVALSATKIRFALAGMTLLSKLIDGTFPDYQRVIPAGNDRRLRVDTDAIVAALDRVSTVSSERGRAVKLALAGGRLVLTVTNPDAGEAVEELEVEYDEPAMEIGFNARYLAELLPHAGADTTLIRLDNPGSPTLFEARDGADALYVLMPMRV